MALINCKECGNQISNKAKSCPHCGNTKPEPTKIGCGTIILGLFIFSILYGIFDDHKERSKPVKPKTAEELRQEQLAPAFSAWNGSHINLTNYVKSNLKDPDSYEHIKTTYKDNGETLTIYMRYRAKNSFGGYVVNSAVATAQIDGTLVSVDIGK